MLVTYRVLPPFFPSFSPRFFALPLYSPAAAPFSFLFAPRFLR